MSTKKPNIFTYAKEIRETGEPWQEAVSRATEQLYGHKSKPRTQHAFRGRTKSECYGLEMSSCNEPCHWVAPKKQNKRTGKTAKPYCALKRVGLKKAGSLDQALEQSYPEQY